MIIKSATAISPAALVGKNSKVFWKLLTGFHMKPRPETIEGRGFIFVNF